MNNPIPPVNYRRPMKRISRWAHEHPMSKSDRRTMLWMAGGLVVGTIITVTMIGAAHRSKLDMPKES
jgi:hypothetical protein